MGCNFLHCEIEENKEYCEAREISKQIHLEKETKPDWCPLKPVPEKRQTTDDFWQGCVNIVRNHCIDEILGDKE